MDRAPADGLCSVIFRLSPVTLYSSGDQLCLLIAKHDAADYPAYEPLPVSGYCGYTVRGTERVCMRYSLLRRHVEVSFCE